MSTKEFNPDCPRCFGEGKFCYGGSFGGEVHYAECDCWVENFLKKQKEEEKTKESNNKGM